jgi:YfiH family protein
MASEPAHPFPVPAYHHAGWSERFPWLIHGITTRGETDRHGPSGFDLRLRGPASTDAVLSRWDAMGEIPGIHAVVHARQVHGAIIRTHRDIPPGLLLAPSCDGHFTREPGVLLTVGVADCVPVYLVSESPRQVALLHAGWRGIAAGILEAGLQHMKAMGGGGAESIHLLLGPSISGARYEVGPEVHRAVTGAAPQLATGLDLRGHLRERALALGVLERHLSLTQTCVFEDSAFFSHRRGCQGRQVAFLGLRATHP